MPQPAAAHVDRGAPGKRRRRGRRLGLCLLLLLLLTSILEAALRTVWGLGNPLLYRLDEDCGYLPAPGQSVRHFGALTEINAFSMRSPEVTRRKPPGAYRILFVGDSVCFGTSVVDQSRITTSLLQRELGEQLHRPVEVLNASAGGWAPANELGFIRSRGVYDADEVIFLLNTGDLVQPFSPGRLSLAIGYPDHKPVLAIQEVVERYVIPYVRFRMAHDAGSTATGAPDVDGQTPAVLHTLEEARTIAERAHARFGIVYSPGRGEFENAAYQDAFARLKSWAGDHDVPLLDLGPAFRAHAGSIYQDQIHPNAEGQRVAADTIERQWPWIVGTPTTGPAQ